jgi:hypothetical protein
MEDEVPDLLPYVEEEDEGDVIPSFNSSSLTDLTWLLLVVLQWLQSPPIWRAADQGSNPLEVGGLQRSSRLWELLLWRAPAPTVWGSIFQASPSPGTGQREICGCMTSEQGTQSVSTHEKVISSSLSVSTLDPGCFLVSDKVVFVEPKSFKEAVSACRL